MNARNSLIENESGLVLISQINFVEAKSSIEIKVKLTAIYSQNFEAIHFSQSFQSAFFRNDFRFALIQNVE